MDARKETTEIVRSELANRLFFKLYQCANLLHKTGTKAVESEGLTTQQWAILGALSRPGNEPGINMGELARYLMVSRQNLSGVLGRMERDGRIEVVPDTRDRRSRLIRITEEGGKVWNEQAQPKIHDYYQAALEGFSVSDQIHATHYLIKLLDNMERLDRGGDSDEVEAD
jgi:DNA-binding MarR family transcriptional regulator